MDGIWIVYLFLAAFPGLIVFAAVYKYVEVRQAARWPSVPGRVVRSGQETRRVRSGGPDSDDTEPRNFAKIVYEYTIADRKYRCDRVSIGEDLGNFQVAETIARYPVGKPVTVYYDPNERSKAVLERDLPPGIWKGVTIIVLVLAGLIVGSIVGFRKLGDVMSAFVRDPTQAPFVTACIGFGLLAAFFIYGIQRHVGRMTAWPTARGRIEESDVREFQALSQSGSHRRWTTMYRPDVVYSYEVAGVRYIGDKRGTTGRFSASMTAFVRGGTARYPTGEMVEIHYNPENPAESVLDPRAWPLLLLWLIPAAVFALGYVVAR
ncbi:MAG: hypothetical protein JWN71_2795 [Xanthobacteraceae bacterium]|nr:hypothetical protein [Xanthobacteraceae bacterium]